MYFQKEYDVFLKFTRHAGHAIEIVKQVIVEDKVDVIIGVGGDGTFSEVVNGYMQVEEALRKHVVLAAFPRGAGNDFSRSSGRIESMEHLYSLVKENRLKPLDIVKVSYCEADEWRIRYFDNSFDIGIGGLVCKYVNVSNKTWGSNFTYFYNIIKAFTTFKRIPVKIVADNFEFEGRVLLVSINNGKYFGSGLCVAPDAQLDDGVVDVLIARKINVLQFLTHVPALRKGKKINLSEIFYYKLRKCTIESSQKDCPMELDGEVVGCVPLKIEVLKHAAAMLNVEK